ncbi:MAG: hydrolase [Desulfomonilaceae bacterium]
MNTGSCCQYLDSVHHNLDELTETIVAWAEMNTGSLNIGGLGNFVGILEDSFLGLSGKIETILLQPQIRLRPEGRISLTLGKAFSVRKKLDAPIRALLTIHYDTVYGVEHPFQKCRVIDHNTIVGPGVADAKGGLLVLLRALELFEASPWSDHLGWEVLITPDEEIGSTGSAPLLLNRAGRNHFALVFEPALPDGSLVLLRNGSSVYSARLTGRSAHAGREPERGRNAIHAMAGFIMNMKEQFENRPGIILNVGEISGGGPVNIVPDLAYSRFNVRTHSEEDGRFVDETLRRLAADLNGREGFKLELSVDYSRPPKMSDRKSLVFFEHVANCGREIGVDIKWGHSGGASDANIIAQAGIPVLDGLGVRGGSLHSPEEYIQLDSLVERIRLTALLLMKFASGNIPFDRNIC